MFSRIVRAAGGLAAVACVVFMSAAPAPASPGVVPVGVTVDEFDLGPPEGSPDVAGRGIIPPAPAPESRQAPLVAPLPPAIATGMAGLAAMAVLRVGRRIHRRR